MAYSKENSSETNRLVNLASAGDAIAIENLFTRYRDQLRRMIATRLDPRIASRVDASDVVQDSLVRASRRLQDYLRDRPLPFYPWLRQFAAERLIEIHRQHVSAQARSVTRETCDVAGESRLAEKLISVGLTPSQHMRRDEQKQEVQQALDRLGATDREILVLRHIECLATREVASVLCISVDAAKKRQLRALERLARELRGTQGDISR